MTKADDNLAAAIAAKQAESAANPPTFKRSQLRDLDFYRANEAAILKAARAGEIEDDSAYPWKSVPKDRT
jgi:hypothetical protein